MHICFIFGFIRPLSSIRRNPRLPDFPGVLGCLSYYHATNHPLDVSYGRNLLLAADRIALIAEPPGNRTFPLDLSGFKATDVYRYI